MKYILLYCCLFCNAVLAQTKSVAVHGYKYLNISGNNLYMFADRGDRIERSIFSIFADTVVKEERLTVSLKSIENSYEFPTLEISKLDAGFNLVKELKGKVYCVTRPANRDYYYLKNDSTWVHLALTKRIVWVLEKEETTPLFRIDLANNRFAYCAHYSGLIFKQNGEVKTNFTDLRYFYRDPNTRFSIANMDTVDMSSGYFEYGSYRCYLINYDSYFRIDSTYDQWMKSKRIFTRLYDQDLSGLEWKYRIVKNNKTLLDNLFVKYYNDKQLIAYDRKTVTYYNTQFKVDSEFVYRDMVEGYEVEYISGNEIKKINIQNCEWAFQDNRRFVCGTVGYYAMHVRGKDITEHVLGPEPDQEQLLKSYHGMPGLTIDSMQFLKGGNTMEWNGNGGFDNRVLLFKNGKCGMYTFDESDTVLRFEEVLPMQFDRIYLMNNIAFVQKDGHMDTYFYYHLHKKLRFVQVEQFDAIFIRYKTNENRMGWMNRNEATTDDL